MKYSYTRAAQGILALSASALLIACGSGNNSSAPPPTPTTVGTTDVPIAATQDSSAAFSFVQMVVDKGEANTDNPLVLSDAANDPALAISETADPMPVAA